MQLCPTEYIVRGQTKSAGPFYIGLSYTEECRILTASDAASEVYEALHMWADLEWSAERIDRDHETGKPESIRDATEEVAAIVDRLMAVPDDKLAPKYAAREERERIEWELAE